ncbi:MAG: hypothetical protein H6510_07355 [Acidobacteria bacterium]|nr:hypothetical protein [Acidobacteriota bacterium]MCB9397613.1 hypothetical protein [Acidobacteriota bacterium]
MKNALCFLCSLGILGWAQPEGWQEGIAYYRAAVRDYPLVTLGEIHQLEAQFGFLRLLLLDPEIQKSLNDVAVSFANSRYQATLDRYVLQGEDVSEPELKRVWSDHSESPTGPFDSPIYADFVHFLRELNQSKGQNERIRLVAADLPIEWANVQDREAYRALGSRSSFMGQRVVSEILARKRRGLFIVGGAHLAKVGVSPSGQPMENAYAIVNSAFPGQILSVNAVISFGPKDPVVLPQLKGVPVGSVAVLSQHFLGELPAPMLIRADQAASETAQKGFKRKDLYDAYLWLGMPDQAHYILPPPETYADETLWQELNRRSRIRFGQDLDPATRLTGRLRPLDN